MLRTKIDGEVAEWFKAATGNRRYTVKSRIGGSNPSPLRRIADAAFACVKLRQAGY